MYDVGQLCIDRLREIFNFYKKFCLIVLFRDIKLWAKGCKKVLT